MMINTKSVNKETRRYKCLTVFSICCLHLCLDNRLLLLLLLLLLTAGVGCCWLLLLLLLLVLLLLLLLLLPAANDVRHDSIDQWEAVNVAVTAILSKYVDFNVVLCYREKWRSLLGSVMHERYSTRLRRRMPYLIHFSGTMFFFLQVYPYSGNH